MMLAVVGCTEPVSACEGACDENASCMAEAGEAITLRSPDATRPWQHVMDPLYGYMVLATRLYDDSEGVNGEGWNFGPSSDSIRTVLDLTKGLTALWDGIDIDIDIDRPKDAPHEAKNQIALPDNGRGFGRWSQSTF